VEIGCKEKLRTYKLLDEERLPGLGKRSRIRICLKNALGVLQD
jgi:hypothetical protein